MARTATLTPERWFNETLRIVNVVMLACLLSEVYASQKTPFSGDIKTNESYVKSLTDDQTVDHSDSNSAVHRNRMRRDTDEHPTDTRDKITTLNEQTTVPDNRTKEETNRLIDEDRSTPVDEDSKTAKTNNLMPHNTNWTTDLGNSAPDVTSETSTNPTYSMGLGAGSPPSTTKENNSHSNMHAQNQAAAERKRASIAKLHERIRNLRVSRERSAPLTPSDEDGNATETRVVAYVGALSVLAIDDAKQSMVSSVYMLIQWWDRALSWNLSDHHGAREVEMPVDSVWMPIIYFLNSLDHKHILSTLDTVFISYTGEVSARRMMIFETTCDMDLDFYPYDTQNCPLAFLQPSVNLRLDVKLMLLPRALLTSVSYGSQWELLNTTQGNPHPKFSSVILTVRRKTTFYTVSLVLPLVLTSYMNTLVFLLPLQSGEKVSFLVTLFVSTSFFFAFFNDAMPKGLDSVPVVMKLLIGVIVESLLVLIATLFVMRRDMTSRDVTSSMSSDVRNDGPLESARRRETRELFDVVSGNTADAAPNGNNKGLNNYDLYERTSEELVSKSRLSGTQHCLNLNRIDLAFFVFGVVAITVFHAVLYVDTFLRN